MSSSEEWKTCVVGSGNLAILCCEEIQRRGHKLAGIVTRDPAFQQWADQAKLPTLARPKELLTADWFQDIDYLFSVVVEDILPVEVLKSVGQMPINYHDGPLPRYAGTHATSWAILGGESQHGITWHRMEERVDAGDILIQRTFPFADEETAFTLNSKCFEQGLESFADLLRKLETGTLQPIVQESQDRSFFGRFKRPPFAGIIHDGMEARQIELLVRGLNFGRSYNNPFGCPRLWVGDRFVFPEKVVTAPLENESSGQILEVQDDRVSFAAGPHKISLEGCRTADGRPSALASHLVAGEKLPRLTDNEIAHLTDRDKRVHREESAWVRRLARLDPVPLPLSVNQQRQADEVTPQRFDLPTKACERLAACLDSALEPETLLAVAFASYLGRLACRDQFYLPVNLTHRAGAIESRLFADYLPMRFQIAQGESLKAALASTAAAFEKLAESSGYARDIVLRYPQLRDSAFLAEDYVWPACICFSDGKDDYPGPALMTLVLADTPYFLVRGTASDVAMGQEILGPFATFLESIIASSNAPLRTANLLPPDEQQRVLSEFNATVSDYDPNVCVHELVAQQAQSHPDATAVCCDDSSLTYRELDEQSDRIASHLVGLGVGKETLVGVCLDRSLLMPAAVLGVLKAGGTYVPLDPGFPPQRLALMLEDSHAPVVVTESACLTSLPEHGARNVILDEEWDEILQYDLSESASGPADAESLAYVIYTSGSTGKPKGVAIPHGALVNFLHAMRQRPGFGANDTLLAVTTLSFDISALELFLPLVTGARVTIVGREIAANGHDLMERVQSIRPTVMQATPATWRMLLEVGALPAGMKILCGGEPLPRDLAEALLDQNCELWNMYGPTETTIWSTVERVERDGATVSIGRPIDNTQVYVVDPNLEPTPVGFPGELLIGGDGLARGYLDRPELTAERFVEPTSGMLRNQRLYRTGDRVKWLRDGRLAFFERMDNQVKLRGFRIELGEIESVLAKHPQVRQAVVTIREDRPGDKRLVGYAILADDARVSVTELKTHVGDSVPDYMVPATVVFLDEFPQTPNRKVDRKALPAPDTTRSASDQSYCAPRNKTETRLESIWSEVLGVRDIGVHDDFFDLGGHSILALKLFSQIEKEFGQKWPMQTLFGAPTIALLADRLQSNEVDDAWEPLVTLQRGGSAVPFFVMHPMNCNLLCYADLARQLGPEQPVYGIQPRGLDGEQECITNLEEMAATYIAAVRDIQPKGPYQLGGVSFGGDLAYEMARQLEEGGEEIGLVALFDTQGPGWGYPADLSPRKRQLYQFVERLRSHWLNFSHHDWQNRPGYIVGVIKTAIERYKKRIQTGSRARLPPEVRRVRAANLKALHGHEHKPTTAKLTLFRARHQSLGVPFDPLLHWGDLARGGIDVEVVPGYHGENIREPYIRRWAHLLRERLEDYSRKHQLSDQ